MPDVRRSICILLKLAPFNRLFAGPASESGLDGSLLAGEVALGLWLVFAVQAFTGKVFIGWPDVLGLSVAITACSWRLGLHRPAFLRSWPSLLGRSLVLAPLSAFAVLFATAWRGPAVGLGFALWLGAGLAFLFLAFRLGLWVARAAWPGQPLEIFRWLAVGGAGFVLLLPFYGRHGFGSGDVYWYVTMLADVVAQVRHGVFPVWVGQTEYAFNGAVSPLRLAPLFQYAGAGVDLLTCHALEPAALANAVLCAAGLAAAASAYLAVHLALPRRPGLACVLALLWLASPGVLAPLYAGFQFMEWIALPFLPILLYGCWRLWARDDVIARLAIVAALGGMMLGHTPTALWGGILAAGMYGIHLAVRRNWAREGPRLAAMAAGFALLGGFPIGSVLAIGNEAGAMAGGQPPWIGFGTLFPGNFLPLDPQDLMSIKSYQLGYSLLAGGLVALALLAWLRPRGATSFVLATLVLVPLTMPVPGLTNWIWSHAPRLVMAITLSPTQRLFEFWAIIIVFALALAAGHPRLDRHPWAMALLLLALAAGGAWSATEAAKFLRGIQATVITADAMNVSLLPENLRLARYAYAPFSGVPNTASQAHVDPVLENRLLDRPTLQPLASNAEAAAPRLRADSEIQAVPRLVQTGLWTASSDNHSRYYRLAPPLRLEPARHYALRVDFLRPEKEGFLQIINDDIFREYALPDSGLGLSSVPMAFGSLPTSSHVAALEQNSPGPAEPPLRFVAPEFLGQQFAFARFWLFSYAPEDLPIHVLSWVPYRAELGSAGPAYLETPRIWQRGWRAEVNGQPVAAQESPHHLVMIPVEPGESRVVLSFRPALWLSALFWASLAGWAGLAGWCFTRVTRKALPCVP